MTHDDPTAPPPSPDADAGRTRRFEPPSEPEESAGGPTEREATARIDVPPDAAPDRDEAVPIEPLPAREATARIDLGPLPDEDAQAGTPDEPTGERTALLPELRPAVERPAAPPAESGVVLESPAAVTRPQAQPIGEVTTSKRPLVEELEKPYSLEPDEPPEPAASTSPKARRRSRWMAAGVALGVAAGAIAYVRPHDVRFETAPPVVDVGTALPAIGGAPPPTRWMVAGEGFLGVDADNRPWLYEPESAKARRADAYVPAAWAEAGRFTMVAQWPLVPSRRSRLAWIEPSASGASGGAPVLRCRDVEFTTGSTATADAPAEPPFDRSQPLPEAEYPFAPVVLPGDAMDREVRLAVVTAAGALTAWAIPAAGEIRQLWRFDADGRPLAAPLVCAAQRDRRALIVAITAGGVQALDAADGRPLGRLAWSLAVPQAALAPVSAANGLAAWAATDGRRVVGFELRDQGAVESLFDIALGEDGPTSAPLRLLAFPGGEQPDEDDLVVLDATGNGVWISGRRPARLTRLQGLRGDAAAMDLSGDGWFDLVVVGPDGALRLADGRSRRVVAARGTTSGHPPASPVVWRLAESALRADYFAPDGRPVRAAVPLPDAAMRRIVQLQADWHRRHPN